MTLFPHVDSPVKRILGVAIACAVLGTLGLATGCSEPDGLRELEEASKDVEILREEVEDAEKAVEKRQGDLVDAQSELDDAIENLRETEGRLSAAEVAVAEIATDDILFRSVQASLLEELEDAAIAARVRDGVVTLTGSVDDPDLRDLAEEIANNTLGVLRVDNRIETVAAPRKPEPTEEIEADEEASATGDV